MPQPYSPSPFSPHKPSPRLAIGALAVAAIAAAAPAQTAQQAAIEVTATVTLSPASIALTWPLDPSATGFTIRRRVAGASSWGNPTILAAPVTTWTDFNIGAGNRYEYWIAKGGSPAASGFLTAGIQAAAVEDRGIVVLLVDAAKVPVLGTRLARLEQDLVGDGWRVIRHDVPSTMTPPNVRQLIVNDNAQTLAVRSVFVLGHVAVPYSGTINPDGHPDHFGAWPADVYYGELDGTWTDTVANTTVASRVENQNVPGDGKFDQSSLPSNVDLAVGRVDLSNMTLFLAGEDALLQQYLDKDHDYRHKVFAADARAVIDDNFGYFAGEAFAANGWRNFAALVGPANVIAADYFTTLNTTSGGGYLWSYGCGGGSYLGASGIGTTNDFAASQNRGVFTMLFGSYFGDWDFHDSFLRAPLCQGWTLANVWAGRPNWSFHPMGLGATIGDCAKYSQNDSTAGGFGTRFVHVALMGDPTLREHVIAPPGGVAVTDLWPQANVTWAASADPVAGYHVYRAASPQGPFTRLTSVPVAATAFTDPAAIAGSSTYMVRALRLETTPTGTYWNLSQGAFATAALPQAPAAHTSYGDGCYRVSDSFHATFATPALAAAALGGNSYTLVPGNGGYTVSHGGAAFVPPTASAALLPAGDDTEAPIQLSLPLPLPSGSTSTLYVNSNGIIATSPLGMNGPTTALPDVAAMLGEPATAFYCWHDYDPSEIGSGPIRFERLNNTLYVTWDGVESKPAGLANPSTLQFQFDLASGVVHVVFAAVASAGTGAHLFGYSPGGPSVDGGEIALATALPLVVGAINLEPLALSASPAPIVTATTGTVATYAVDHVPALGGNTHLGFVVFGFVPDLGGASLAGYGMAGCRQYVAQLLVTQLFTSATPSGAVTLALPAGFPRGVSIYAQALALSPPNGLPNGQNPLGAVTSNGVQSFVNDH